MFYSIFVYIYDNTMLFVLKSPIQEYYRITQVNYKQNHLGLLDNQACTFPLCVYPLINYSPVHGVNNDNAEMKCLPACLYYLLVKFNLLRIKTSDTHCNTALFIH